MDMDTVINVGTPKAFQQCTGAIFKAMSYITKMNSVVD